MFERFTDRARRTVVLAQENSRLLGYDYIGSEHLLLGLLQEEAGVAALVLADAGLELESLRAKIVELYPPGDSSPPGHIPFTDGCRKVIELALREALQLGHSYIGTEHLLLAIIREVDCSAAEVLRDLGLAPVDARRAVINKLSGYQGPMRTEGEAPPAAPKSRPDPWGDHLRREMKREQERLRGNRYDRLRRQLEEHRDRRLFEQRMAQRAARDE